LLALYRRLEDELANTPGVQGVGLAMYNPLTDNWGEGIEVAGHPQGELGGDNNNASWDRISPNYFQNLGMPIVLITKRRRLWRS
jgi:hypothetical protein